MNEDVQAFAVVMVVIVTSIAALVAIGLGARILWRWGSRVQPSQQPTPAVDDSRLQRLENAVEAIAIEVERISEGQRFTVSLLSERLPARGERMAELGTPGGPKRVNTPH